MCVNVKSMCVIKSDTFFVFLDTCLCFWIVLCMLVIEKVILFCGETIWSIWFELVCVK